MDKTLKKYAFPRKVREFVDKYSGPEKEYYEKFCNEWYSNSVSKLNLTNQLNNTEEAVELIYEATNARNRDLMSNLKITGKLESKEVESDKPLYQDDKYNLILKQHGFNEALKELFEDTALECTQTRENYNSYLTILKNFYINLGKINREERKFKKMERLIGGKK